MTAEPMRIGDIWAKDTRHIYEDGTLEHWLILDVETRMSHYLPKQFVYVLYIVLESGQNGLKDFVGNDFRGNPYYKKVA